MQGEESRSVDSPLTARNCWCLYFGEEVWRDTFQIPFLQEGGLPWVTAVKHGVWFPIPPPLLCCHEIWASGSSSRMLYGTGWLKGHLHSLLLPSPEVVPEPTRPPGSAFSGAPSAEAKMQNWSFILGILCEEVRLQKSVLRVTGGACVIWPYWMATLVPFFPFSHFITTWELTVLGAFVIHWIVGVPVIEGISLNNQILTLISLLFLSVFFSHSCYW